MKNLTLLLIAYKQYHRGIKGQAMKEHFNSRNDNKKTKS